MTGRLIKLGLAKRKGFADSLLVTLACSKVDNLRQLVPLRLTTVSQPICLSQWFKFFSGSPCFLKS